MPHIIVHDLHYFRDAVQAWRDPSLDLYPHSADIDGRARVPVFNATGEPLADFDTGAAVKVWAAEPSFFLHPQRPPFFKKSLMMRESGHAPTAGSSRGRSRTRAGPESNVRTAWHFDKAQVSQRSNG